MTILSMWGQNDEISKENYSSLRSMVVVVGKLGRVEILVPTVPSGDTIFAMFIPLKLQTSKWVRDRS